MKDSLVDLDQKAVEEKYGKRFTELRQIINKHDPLGLIDIGAPEDEYDPEVKTIIVQLKMDMTEKEVHDLIFQEFKRWFDLAAGKKEDYKELAMDVWEWNVLSQD